MSFSNNDPRGARTARLATLFAATALLAACGGGGGGGGDSTATPAPAGTAPPTAPGGGGGAVPAPPAAPTSLEQVQGFWSGSVDAGSTLEAVILPNGEAWLVLHSGGQVRSAGRAQGVLNGAGVTATGILTDLTAGTTQALTVQATSVLPKSTLAASLSVLLPARSVTWAYNARYDTAVPVAAFAGHWQGSAGQQRIGATWDITAAGALTGTSTIGCTYTGTLAAHAQAPSVVKVSLTETCTSGTQTFTGIATMNESRTQTSYVLTYASGAQASFVAMQK